MNVPAHAQSPGLDTSEWAERRVLVTGATRFIGSAVTPRLSGRGARIVGVVGA
jgi:NAD(P)-dependent dehydrogenase (short-subunit alcohol dehydrogenase family)